MKHWSAMLMLSKDCGTQRKREKDKEGEYGVRERPENVAPCLKKKKGKTVRQKGGRSKRESVERAE